MIGEHHGRLREGDRRSRGLERSAEKARSAERREEGDPSHRGREYERQLDQRQHERPPSEAPRGDR